MQCVSRLFPLSRIHCCATFWCSSWSGSPARQWTDAEATRQRACQHTCFYQLHWLKQLKHNINHSVMQQLVSVFILNHLDDCIDLHLGRFAMVNHCPTATSAECNCPVGDGPFFQPSTSVATLVSCSFLRHVQGRSADVPAYVRHMSARPWHQPAAAHHRRLHSSDDTNCIAPRTRTSSARERSLSLNLPSWTLSPNTSIGYYQTRF